MNGQDLSNRILGYSFLASVLINMGWVAWVAHSSVFGGAVTLTSLHERPIRIFKPVPVKPQPKIVTPLPPPPPKPPKAQAEIKPLRPLRLIAHVPPSPHRPPVRHTQLAAPATPRTVSVAQGQPAPAQTAPAQTAPAPIASRPASPSRPVIVAALPHSAGSLLRAPESGNSGPIQPAVPAPTQPEAPAVRQIEPTPAVKAPERVGKQTEPEVKRPDPVPAVRHVEEVRPQPEPEQVKPKPVEHPKGWVDIKVREASWPDGLASNVSTDGIDPTSVTNPEIVISFVIDETGHPRNVRVKRSCGNPELDQRFVEAVRRAHCTPAIQDNIPREQPVSQSFPVSTG